MRKYFLPLILFLFSLIGLTTLKSIVPDLLYKQGIAFLIAFSLFFFFANFSFETFVKYAKWFYIVLNVVLLLLLVWGKVTRGISAWIVLPFGFKFQPSQLATPITALYLSSFFKKEIDFSWKKLFEVLLVIFIPTALILLEPDFGTALVFLVSMSVFVFFNRLDFQKVLSLVSLGVIAFSLLWLFVLKPYQKARLFGFANLSNENYSQLNREETSAEYNARQALIAVGSGQLWGRGLGQGIQSQLRFLPERQTDFIFASFAEEWGFVGTSLILFLYFVFLLFLLLSAYNLESFPQKLYLLSLFTMFLVQLLINIGMNLALLPITGITLPFLSYGGSSIISFFFALSVVESILISYQKKPIFGFY